MIEARKKIQETLLILKRAEEAVRASKLVLNELLAEYDASEDVAGFRQSRFYIIENETKEGISQIKFTNKEIEKMPKRYQKLFATNSVIAHVRQRSCGVYEIRCQISGKKLTASSKNLETAKNKFMQLIEDLDKAETLPIVEPEPVLFREYAEKWLESVKRPTVKAVTYADYLSVFESHLFPTFGEKPLNMIKQFDVQDYLNELVASGKVRAAHKHRQILKSLFEYACIDDLVTKSPMLKIKLPYHEAENGQALTKDEELAFVEKCLSAGTRSGKAFLFILYTGIRRSELASAEVVDGKWIKVLSAKQRIGRKEKTRLIPISPRLRKVLPDLDVEEIRDLYPNRLGRTFKEWLPAHHLHELRHTFITRAQECGISRELVSVWAGHKADNTMTTNVYTHLSAEYQQQEILKFDY